MSKNNNNNEEKLSAKEKREIIKRTLKAVKLIAKGGIYTAMWAAQAEYYKDTAGELFA